MAAGVALSQLVNRALIIVRLLSERGPMTTKQLREATGLTPAALKDALDVARNEVVWFDHRGKVYRVMSKAKEAMQHAAQCPTKARSN